MAKENVPNDQVEEVEIIDGGAIAPWEEFIDGGNIAGEEDKSSDEIRSKTARQLAFTLVYLFAGALAVHYAVFSLWHSLEKRNPQTCFQIFSMCGSLL